MRLFELKQKIYKMHKGNHVFVSYKVYETLFSRQEVRA